MKDETSFLQFRKKVRQSLPFPRKVPKSNWTKRIQVTLGALERRSTDMCIHKVPKELRKVNEDAYSPRIVSIGPLHESEHDLLAMEEHKWRYMLSLLHRTPDPILTLDECGKVILDLEAPARGSYAESIKFNKCELVELMLADGCFILELFLRFSNPDLRNQNDSDLIFRNAWMVPTLRHDLALLENQIPFSILEHLFNNIVPLFPEDKRPKCSITDLALSFFLPHLELNREATRKKCSHDVRHLLDLLHKFYLHTSPEISKETWVCKNCATEHIEAGIELEEGTEKRLLDRKETWGFKNCATKLLEAGIELEKGTEDRLLDIRFKKGVIKIPPLPINETTDSLLRNLIAFEQCSLGSKHHITSYAILIKSLIPSLPDIKLLQQKRIITNDLGRVEDVFTLFNNISTGVVLKDFYFGNLCKKVNAYPNSWCQRHSRRAFWKVWWDRQMATLKRNYFPNAWRGISVFAAVLLLLLTGLQTIYTVWSFYAS